jgi:hypothetical protein
VSREIVASAGGVWDVNNTCDVLHVARSAQFNSSDVLKQIFVAQQLLASGTSLPASVNEAFGAQTGAAWLGEDSSDVMSCSWSKDIDGVVGTISVQLKPRTQYLETIFPGDLLFVFMSDAGDYDPSNRFAATLVTVVIVDRVAEPTAVQQQATVVVVNVTARDLAVVLSESSTVFDQAFSQLENAAYTGEFIGRLFGEKKQLALSPLENVLVILLLLYDARATGSALASLQWKLTATDGGASSTQLVSLLDVTSYVQNPLPFYAIAEPPGIVQAGNVWSLLESYSNPLVNEFFIDVRDVSPQERQFRSLTSASAKAKFYSGNPDDVANQDAAVRAVLDSDMFRPSVTRVDGGSTTSGSSDGTSVVALVMRQRPYDSDAFNALPVTEVDSTEIETSELARSSHDVHNWFRVRFPGLDVKVQELVAGIRMVPQSVAKFGFRRMEAETRYMFSSSDASVTFSQGSTKTDFGDVFRQYVDLLSTWYSQNEFWYAGHLTMRLRPSIRVGTRLRLTRRDRIYDFYVQGVQHNFVKDPGASRSSLTLTRGRVVSSATVPLVPVADFQHDGFGVSEGSQ